jgi:hypothetical protein
LQLETDGPLVAAAGDYIYAVLPLASATMPQKSGIRPIGRKCVGAQFLKLLPCFWRNVFGMGMNIHSERFDTAPHHYSLEFAYC